MRLYVYLCVYICAFYLFLSVLCVFDVFLCVFDLFFMRVYAYSCVFVRILSFVCPRYLAAGFFFAPKGVSRNFKFFVPKPSCRRRFFFVQKGVSEKMNMSHIIKLAFLHFQVLFSNVSSPAKMTITARTAPQFCAKTRAERAEVYFLTPIPY